MSSEGRYPSVLYNFILGNQQQATVVFGQAKTEPMQLCFKFTKIKSGK